MPQLAVKPVVVTMIQAFATHRGITFDDAVEFFQQKILVMVSKEMLKDSQPKEVSKNTGPLFRDQAC